MTVELGVHEELLYARYERIHPPGHPAGERLIFAIIKVGAGKTTRFGEHVLPRLGFEEFVEAVCDERRSHPPREGVRVEVGERYFDGHLLLRMLEMALEDFRMKVIHHDLQLLARTDDGKSAGGIHLLSGGKP